jgi:hypothetical protein
MTTPASPQIEINGDPPIIEGRICQGFVCEGYKYEGMIAATANVTHLKFDDQWYRLYFEPWLVFWRKSEQTPAAWAVDEKSWEYPVEDVGAIAAVIGTPLLKYEISATADGCKAIFTFNGGKRIVIEDKNEVASYAVI